MDIIMSSRGSDDRLTTSVYGCGPSSASSPHGYQRNTTLVRKLCRYWASGNCKKGEACRFVHSWSIGGDGLCMVTQLHGHKKSICGIVLPSGSDHLFSAGDDGTLRVWDCHTGHCLRVISFGSEIGCLIAEGSWVFIGLPNKIRAWNTENGFEVDVKIPNVGQIHCIAIAGNTLFTGNQDGSISALKVESVPKSGVVSFKLAGSAKIHKEAVTGMKIGAGKRLFTSSKDKKIKVWDAETLKFVGVLEGHTQEVTSLVCIDQFLISCSLDRKVKVWNDMNLVYTQEEEAGVLAMNGVTDAQGKPFLVCALVDETARVYELPSFEEKGKIFSKKGVCVVQMGPSGMFFSGDNMGSITVWKMEPKSS